MKKKKKPESGKYMTTEDCTDKSLAVFLLLLVVFNYYIKSHAAATNKQKKTNS